MTSNDLSKGGPDHTDPANFPQWITEDDIHVELTYSPIDVATILARVRSPNAGANVLFLGTTRNSFEDKPVSKLEYQSYAPLALRSFSEIATGVLQAHKLTKVSITHRLGTVPIGQESIAIAVSSPHRKAAWVAGEEALEKCKERAEIWKREDLADEQREGEWRANRDQDPEGRQIDQKVSRVESDKIWNEPWS